MRSLLLCGPGDCRAPRLYRRRRRVSLTAELTICWRNRSSKDCRYRRIKSDCRNFRSDIWTIRCETANSGRCSHIAARYNAFCPLAMTALPNCSSLSPIPMDYEARKGQMNNFDCQECAAGICVLHSVHVLYAALDAPSAEETRTIPCGLFAHWPRDTNFDRTLTTTDDVIAHSNLPERCSSGGEKQTERK